MDRKVVLQKKLEAGCGTFIYFVSDKRFIKKR